MKGLDGGRVNISALSLGGAQAALNRSIEYTSQRKQFGKPLNENQWVQFTIADMTTRLTAARLMVHRAAEMVDAKHPQASMHAAMAKKFATEACSDIADQALQLHGGYGYLQDFPLEKIVRDLRVHQILEGTNQIMQQITFKNITSPLNSVFNFVREVLKGTDWDPRFWRVTCRAVGFSDKWNNNLSIPRSPKCTRINQRFCKVDTTRINV